jgi:hypothetical protein
MWRGTAIAHCITLTLSLPRAHPCSPRVQIAPSPGRGRHRFSEGTPRRLVCLGWPGGRGRRTGRGAPPRRQHTAFDRTHPAPWATHRDLRLPVALQHGRGHIPQKVVVARALGGGNSVPIACTNASGWSDLHPPTGVATRSAHGRAKALTRRPAAVARARRGAAPHPRWRLSARPPANVSWPFAGCTPAPVSTHDALSRSSSAPRAGSCCRAARRGGERPREDARAASDHQRGSGAGPCRPPGRHRPLTGQAALPTPAPHLPAPPPAGQADGSGGFRAAGLPPTGAGGGPDHAPDGGPLGAVPPRSTEEERGGRRPAGHGDSPDPSAPRPPERSGSRRSLLANETPWGFHARSPVSRWCTPRAHHNLGKTLREKSILALRRIVVFKRTCQCSLTRAFWTVGVVTPWSLAISLRVSGPRSIMERLMFDSASGRTYGCIGVWMYTSMDGSGFVKRTCQCSLTRAFWTVGVVTPWSLAISPRLSESMSFLHGRA